MPVPLTLGLPQPRDRAGLTDKLLLPRSGTIPAAYIGPLIVPASDFDASDGDVIVALDAEPPHSDRIVRYHLDVPADQLGEAVRLQGPLAIFVTDPDAETTRAIAAAGHSAGIAVSEPAERIADFLAVIAHTDVGFVARAASGAEVLEILAATVAALRGDDIRAALANPTAAALISLHPDAGAAVREVLLGVEIDDVDEASAYLAGLGLI